MTFEEACEALGGPLEPTREEKRNGWTRESLTLYHAERKMSAEDGIFNPRKEKPMKTNSAMRWL